MTFTLPKIDPAEVTSEDGSIWIFGYGSLVHSPNFPHDRVVWGYIHGFKRVFWQGSTDHRGTPQQPGRTVTLAPATNAKVWGAAFRLTGSLETQSETLAYLEWREKQYDLRERVDVFTKDPHEPAVRGALCYIATASPANPNYLGDAPLDEIAAQIAVSRGPSGPNWEYLFKLTEAMRAVGQLEDELAILESKVKAKLAALDRTIEALDVASEQGMQQTIKKNLNAVG